jgi:hypothetical protein
MIHPANECEHLGFLLPEHLRHDEEDTRLELERIVTSAAN